ncbi:MAG TPA: hypothetical protein DEA08_02035, partial [Planctomycetes bacterium]|nr:hypothetical protein [Planctomycetota bacterium]
MNDHPSAPDRSAPEPNPRLRHGVRFGCAVVLLLLPAWGAAAHLRARKDLDAALAAAKSEVASRSQHLQGSRAPVFGAPTPGNAADDYVAALYVLSAGTPKQRPERWQEDPPLVPASAVLLAQQLERAQPITPAMSGELYRHLSKGAPLTSATQAVVGSYLPVLQFLREGVHRERCVWDFPWEEGWGAAVPNLISVRILGGLLAFHSQNDADPRRALRTDLELLGFAADLTLQPPLITQVIAVGLIDTGCKSLCKTLARPDLSREDYLLALEAVGRIQLVPTQRTLDDENLLTRISLLADSGRKVLPGAQGSMGGLYELDVFGAWELRNLQRVYERTRTLLRAPRPERLAGLRRLEEELEGTRSIVLGIAQPDWSLAQDQVWGARMTLASARVLVAAHLYRCEHGRFPARLEELRALLGGNLPADLFGEGPLRLFFDERSDELRCSSVGPNGVDEQKLAKGTGDDYGSRTR